MRKITSFLFIVMSALATGIPLLAQTEAPPQTVSEEQPTWRNLNNQQRLQWLESRAGQHRLGAILETDQLTDEDANVARTALNANRVPEQQRRRIREKLNDQGGLVQHDISAAEFIERTDWHGVQYINPAHSAWISRWNQTPEVLPAIVDGNIGTSQTSPQWHTLLFARLKLLEAAEAQKVLKLELVDVMLLPDNRNDKEAALQRLWQRLHLYRAF